MLTLEYIELPESKPLIFVQHVNVEKNLTAHIEREMWDVVTIIYLYDELYRVNWWSTETLFGGDRYCSKIRKSRVYRVTQHVDGMKLEPM